VWISDEWDGGGSRKEKEVCSNRREWG